MAWNYDIQYNSPRLDNDDPFSKCTSNIPYNDEISMASIHYISNIFASLDFIFSLIDRQSIKYFKQYLFIITNEILIAYFKDAI